MKNSERIKQLEEDGWEVFIDHDREYYPVKGFHNKVFLSPTGGCTNVSLYGKGFSVHAKARCSKHDNYNKKLGVTIALGRAEKLIKNLRVVT